MSTTTVSKRAAKASAKPAQTETHQQIQPAQADIVTEILAQVNAPDAPIVPLTQLGNPEASEQREQAIQGQQAPTLTAEQQAEADAKAARKAEIDALYSEVKASLGEIAKLPDNEAFAKYRNLFAKVSGFMLPRPDFKTMAGAQGDTDQAKLIRKNALEKCKTHNHPFTGAVKMLSNYALTRWESGVKEKANMRQLKSGSVAVRSSRSVTLKVVREEFRPFSVSA